MPSSPSLWLVVIASCAMMIHALVVPATTTHYTITDVDGPSRALDGIGGLSGGGATSVLLWTYPEPQRSEILDFLFKPNFGASLHILKVEIGGDAQSTDGAEPSHMHNPWDENYERGYEWWLMLEAKKRNPNIKLYGLAWAYPQWVTCTPGTMENCTDSIYSYPNVTAQYIVKWIAAAKLTYGLDIDYVGCWNERPYNDTYIKILRGELDRVGFNSTKIVAPDGIASDAWSIAEDILADPVLAKAVYAIGAHYPGTVSTAAAEETHKPLWASEDDSTYNNDVGAGCWARIINQNYVNGNMTGSINWNLIASYMKGTNWYRAGLMNAMQPWVGSFGTWRADGSWTAGPMVWATAHTTQFTEPHSWHYLRQGSGAGLLQFGGSYVTLKNFETLDFTIVIEKMSHDHSFCVRPWLAPYNTSDETVSILLDGTLGNVSSLHLWYTHWAYYSDDVSVEFEYQGTVPVVGGVVTLNITVNSLYTLTTLQNAGGKGQPSGPVNQPTLFPEVHADDLESCRISGEGKYFADQNGVFECVDSGDAHHGVVMQQMVPLRPVTWGGDIRPHSLIGHRDAKNTSFFVDGYMPEPSDSIMLGVRMQGTDDSVGIIFTVAASTSSWSVWPSVSTVNTSAVFATGTLPASLSPLRSGVWYTFRLDVNGSKLNVWVDSSPVVVELDVSLLTRSGHALIGTMSYGHYTQYDNFRLYSAYVYPGVSVGSAPVVGSAVCVVECNSEVGLMNTSQWIFDGVPNTKTGTCIRYRHEPSLCLAANDAGGATGAWWLNLQACNASDPTQLWSWSFDGISPDVERVSFMYLPASNRCLDMYNQLPEIGAPMDAWPCNLGSNQAFFYDHDAGEIANEVSATCLGLC